MYATETHFGFIIMGSEMHSFRVIAKRNFKFWFGSPCTILTVNNVTPPYTFLWSNNRCTVAHKSCNKKFHKSDVKSLLNCEKTHLIFCFRISLQRLYRVSKCRLSFSFCLLLLFYCLLWAIACLILKITHEKIILNNWSICILLHFTRILFLISKVNDKF